MKLTSKLLRKLILEEYARITGDIDQEYEYPEYQDKLRTLAKSDSKQAVNLAQSLDEPLDVEFDPDNIKTLGKHRAAIDNLFSDGRMFYEKYLMWLYRNTDRRPQFKDPIDPKKAYEYALEIGEKPQKVLKDLELQHQKYMLQTYIKPLELEQ